MTLSDYLKKANNLGVLAEIQCYCTVIANLLTVVSDNDDLCNQLCRISDDLAYIVYKLKK